MSLPDPFPVSRLDSLEAQVGELVDIVRELVVELTPFESDSNGDDDEVLEAVG